MKGHEPGRGLKATLRQHGLDIDSFGRTSMKATPWTSGFVWPRYSINRSSTMLSSSSDETLYCVSDANVDLKFDAPPDLTPSQHARLLHTEVVLLCQLSKKLQSHPSVMNEDLLFDSWNQECCQSFATTRTFRSTKAWLQKTRGPTQLQSEALVKNCAETVDTIVQEVRWPVGD